jgi:hypothetical protein
MPGWFRLGVYVGMRDRLKIDPLDVRFIEIQPEDWQDEETFSVGPMKRIAWVPVDRLVRCLSEFRDSKIPEEITIPQFWKEHIIRAEPNE